MSTEVNPSSAALRNSAGKHTGLLGFDVCGGGKNLVPGELGGGRGDLPLFFAQIFRGKDFGGGACLDKKASALGGDHGRNGCRRHEDHLQLYGNITLVG